MFVWKTKSDFECKVISRKARLYMFANNKLYRILKTKKVFLLAAVATMAGSALLLVSSCISQHQTCVLDSVSAIDSFPQCLDDGVEQEVDCGVAGVRDIRIRDHTILLSTVNPDAYIVGLDLDSFQRKGSFLKKGNGPDEVLFPLFFSQMLLWEEGGHWFGNIVQRGRLLTIDITASLAAHATVLTSSRPVFIDDSNCMMHYPLDSIQVYLKTLSPDATRIERKVSCKDSIYIPQEMGKLNRAHIKTTGDGSLFNVLSTIPVVRPGGGRIAEASISLNTIHLYDTEDAGNSKSLTLCVGKAPSDIYRAEQAIRPLRPVEFEAIRAYDSFFAALYLGTTSLDDVSDRRVKPRIMLFDWEGRPLAEIPLKVSCRSFEFDLAGKWLYLLDPDTESLYRMDVSSLAIPGL